MKRTVRRVILAVLLLAGVAALVLALRPRPVEVEIAEVTRGPMRLTVDEDGRTRIKERYTISAPLAGRLSRIALKPGHAVEVGMALAVIDPGDPALLDPRARAQAQARVSAAEAALQQAEATLAAAGTSLERAQLDMARAREMTERTAGNRVEVENAETALSLRTAEHRAAGFAREIARFDLEQARAALIHTGAGAGSTPEEWRFELKSPVAGKVLRVMQESAAVVGAGTPLIEIGDPTDLEAEIDVLSTDAVAIRPGAAAIFEHWGGERPLRGVVRLVEPAAFTKISALGVEEQRVNVIIDFVDPLEARAGLGDAYRVEARIVTWEGEVLRVPASALFRRGEAWAVYVAAGERAELRPVEIGRRGPEVAEVVSGLGAGERVVLYPSDRVGGGARIVERGRG